MGKSRISEKGKHRKKRGQGTGKDYSPWTEAADFNSQGTAVMLVDPITERQMHFLSLGEKYVFYILRWEEGPIEIREQFPLALEVTNRIAEEMGFLPASNGENSMTTDMLITHRNGKTEAISVKPSREILFAEDDGTPLGRRRANKAARTRQLLYIEKEYWERQGIEFRLVFSEDIDPIYAHNIEAVMRCYREESVRDDVSLIKHMIAHRQIQADLTQKIDFKALANEYGRQIETEESV